MQLLPSYFTFLLLFFFWCRRVCGYLVVKRSSSFRISRTYLHLPSFDSNLIKDGVQSFTNLVQGATNLIPASPEFNSVILSSEEIASSGMNLLGNDLLIFLCATIGIVPLFKWLKASPVIGFLSAGVLLGPSGLHLFSDLDDMESLADFGVLFLLFEQGLELTVDRLKSLSKFAFGMGTLQVVLCTAAFFTFPFVGGVQFLELVGGDASLVDISRVDEALVIGAALSLSSSAFILKILQEKGQLATKYGAAALGILLLQDIAVVPLLVLLPIIETSGPMPLSAQLALVGMTFIKAILGLGGILFIGGKFVRFLFSVVTKTKSSEAFVALCLLVALGTGALTDSLGLSSTLGAFTAGTLLAESNYRTQIESDLKPFRGLLLGLFFLTTGASVEPALLQEQWSTVLALTAGLITFKAVITTFLGPIFGLSKSDSVRTGLLLSGGGEFAFVVLTLADKLHVLPDLLAKILVGVVVISMALTPTLGGIADRLGNYIDKLEKQKSLELAVLSGSIPSSEDNKEYSKNYSESSIVVICGFGSVGENVARFLTSVTDSLLIRRQEGVSPQLVAAIGSSSISSIGNSNGSSNSNMKELSIGTDIDIGRDIKYCAFDLDPDVVIKGFKSGKQVFYGDGSQPQVLLTAGIINPQAFVVTYSGSEKTSKAVERLRLAYPTVPILSRALDSVEALDLLKVGATRAVPDEQETSLRMANILVRDLLMIDSLQLEEVSRSIRIGLEDEERIELEAYQRRNGVKNSVDREINNDEMSMSSSFRSMVEQSQSLGDNVGPILNEVTKRFSNLMESVSFISDQSQEEQRPKNKNKKNKKDVISASSDVNDDKDNELGVLICALPPSKNLKTPATNPIEEYSDP